MSAFAAEEPTPAPAPTGVTAIRVGGASATWDGSKYVAQAEGQIENASVSMAAVMSDSNTHVYLKEDGENQLDAGATKTIALSKAVEKPATVGETGKYKFTLLIGAGPASATPYELEVNWTRTYASRDTGIKAVQNITNMVGAPVVDETTGTITVKMKLGTDLTAIESAVFTSATDATVNTSTAAANNVKVILGGNDKGKAKVYESSDFKAAEALTDDMKANLLPAIFVPKTSTAKLDLGTDMVLTVNAGGAEKKYDVKFEIEPTFTEIKLGDVVGTIDTTAGSEKITFKLPYGGYADPAAFVAALDKMPITYKAASGVTLKNTTGANIASGSKLESVEKAAFTNNSSDDNTLKANLKVANDAEQKVKVHT
ncbi:MAG: hypothetical protein K2P33_05035, partial [Acutalibacter sp.]|nr:hypothetical protein [Acutalibacter sp.]